jgi:hypothetical protein
MTSTPTSKIVCTGCSYTRGHQRESWTKYLGTPVVNAASGGWGLLRAVQSYYFHINTYTRKAILQVPHPSRMPLNIYDVKPDHHGCGQRTAWNALKHGPLRDKAPIIRDRQRFYDRQQRHLDDFIAFNAERGIEWRLLIYVKNHNDFLHEFAADWWDHLVTSYPVIHREDFNTKAFYQNGWTCDDRSHPNREGAQEIAREVLRQVPHFFEDDA